MQRITIMGFFSNKATANQNCTCGHGGEAHQHYRKGTDCGACGRATCAKFKAVKKGKSVLAFEATPLVIGPSAVIVEEQRQPVHA